MKMALRETRAYAAEELKKEKALPQEFSEVEIYDTTLRDGSQSELISFSVEDKLRILKKLDELGIHYIEGGFPASNPKDREFFERAKKIKTRAKLVAFGSTRKPRTEPEDDKSLNELLSTNLKVLCLFGKSWDLHVKHVLKTSLEENLEIIRESVAFLREKKKEVIYDAEHFFDGYKENREYALETLKAAEEAGASCIVLCDTNGGSLPFEVEKIVSEIRRKISVKLGIHAHNDSATGVANTLHAVIAGVEHVQGTINGFGERCGNADLCSIIPNLELKMGIKAIGKENLRKLTELSRFIFEIANLAPAHNLPYVGSSAFAHKGGVHIDAISKMSRSYEHVAPELVGNRRKILISELSGRTAVIEKAKEFGFKLDKNKEEVRRIVEEIKKLEHLGYNFEGAEASFELLLRKNLKKYKSFFELEGFRTIVEKRKDGRTLAEATVRVIIDGKEYFTAAEGDGPVNALDNALRKVIELRYPEIKNMKLADYKVRVLNGERGTAAKVRVLIESKDDRESWGTVGVSENIIEASWQALIESIEYKLLKDMEAKYRKKEENKND